MRLWVGLAFAAVLTILVGAPALAGSWHEAAPMEAPRSQLRAAVVDGEIYVAGGSTIMGPSDIFDVYDPVSNHWRPLESMPEGRDQFGMAAQGGKVYVSGGYSSWQKGAPTASLYAFNTQSGAWMRRASMPGPRVGHTLTAVGNYLYAIGGRGPGDDHVWRYDPQTDQWSNFGAPMPVPRTGHAAAAEGNKIYLIGGRSLSGKVLSRVDVFDTATGKWSAGTSLPIAMIGMAADFVGSSLHVAGGLSAGLKHTLTDHYEMEAGHWRKVTAIPTPRNGLTSAAVGDKWFLFGGGAGSGALSLFTETDAVEVYTP